LSRVRWLFLIARNSTFSYKGRAVEAAPVARELGVRYVVKGSIRKSGNRLRITAQLIDANSGTHVWAKRYDRELADIFVVQDDLTERIVGALEPELGKAERARAKRKRPGNLDAWDLYQRGLSRLYRYTKEELAEARRIFEQAIEKDPQLGPAHSGLAEVYYYSYVYGFAESLSECRDQALPLARRAVELDAEDASAHCTLGRVLYMRREHEAAIPELDMALELNPSLALAHYGLGAVLVFSGRAERSIPHLKSAIRLSPHDPNMGSFLVRLADAQLFMGHHEEAAGWARRALGQTGFQWSRYAVLLAALGHLDRTEEAKRVLNDLLSRRPDFSRRFVRTTHLISDEADFGHYVEGLRKAGVPAR
jgi:tetratricopeptide (TPR) repeat protein